MASWLRVELPEGEKQKACSFPEEVLLRNAPGSRPFGAEEGWYWESKEPFYIWESGAVVRRNRLHSKLPEVHKKLEHQKPEHVYHAFFTVCMAWLCLLKTLPRPRRSKAKPCAVSLMLGRFGIGARPEDAQGCPGRVEVFCFASASTT